MSRLICVACGEVIGVYEPLIVVDDGRQPRLTSVAAEPQLLEMRADFCHCECHQRSLGQGTAEHDGG